MPFRDDDPVVMVVDDERDFLVLTRTLLLRNGFRADVRTRAPGWHELLLADPAVILMDVMLEGENGAEVCRAIKAHPRFGRLPVILVSGQGEDRLKKAADRSGADGFLTKPISKALVLQLADHYVRQYWRSGGLQGMRAPAARTSANAPNAAPSSAPRGEESTPPMHVVPKVPAPDKLRAEGIERARSERSSDEPGS